MPAYVRTVLGDVTAVDGYIYGHEHLILDSTLIADRFPHILLNDVDAAVDEVNTCRAAGVGLMVDCMSMSAGRDAVRLAAISSRTGVHIVAATGLHHDRYYGPGHWTNVVSEDTLVSLFVADLIEGIDRFDYTGPIVERTEHRAGILKVATSGEKPDARDERNISAVARASVMTGAPVLTHCEDGRGAIAQVELLSRAGVPPRSMILSHVDKSEDLGYLLDVASSGAVLELDQSLKHRERGVDSFTVRAITALVNEGFADQIVVGTDGARRSLWRSLGGEPGLSWLATSLPLLLQENGVSDHDVAKIMKANARRAFEWRVPA